MSLLWLVVLILTVLAATAAFIWLSLKLDALKKGQPEQEVDIVEAASTAADSVFNKEFREELKNRGRLHFEKVINENAMFLQQDLRLTTSQLNDFMKEEIKKVLKEEFSTYEESIQHAKDQAIEAIEKTRLMVDEQRQILEKQLQEQLNKEKGKAIERFEKNMGSILNHYILEAIGNEIDLTDQLDYIFSHLEDSKQAIIEDVKNGT